MLSIFKNEYFLLKAVKTNTTKILQDFLHNLKAKNKKMLLLLMPENEGDRTFSVSKTKMPTEYRKKEIRCFKN